MVMINDCHKDDNITIGHRITRDRKFHRICSDITHNNNISKYIDRACSGLVYIMYIRRTKLLIFERIAVVTFFPTPRDLSGRRAFFSRPHTSHHARSRYYCIACAVERSFTKYIKACSQIIAQVLYSKTSSPPHAYNDVLSVLIFENNTTLKQYFFFSTNTSQLTASKL